MNNLGVEIGGNFVSFAELRSDVQACYRKGMGSNFCFLPETVEALLDYIAAQQTLALDAAKSAENFQTLDKALNSEWVALANTRRK